MDNFVYDSFDRYFQTLHKLGYVNDRNVQSLLILNYYFNLIYNDYRGYISEEDYKYIEKALNCLYGTNCLIPYPDYLKMGKLRLGDMAELSQRIKTIEDTDVVKVSDLLAGDPDSDVLVIEN